MNKELFLKNVVSNIPEVLLEKRVEIECNVIGGIANDILTLDEIKITRKDFITNDGRFYFGVLKTLRNKGIDSFELIDVDSILSEDILNKFKEMGGYDAVRSFADVINKNNFDFYIDQLNKSNIIIDLYKSGFNVTKKVEVRGKEVIPIDEFKNLSSEEVLDWYVALISDYDKGTSTHILEEEIFDFDDKWVTGLDDGESLGESYDYADVDINGEVIKCFPNLSNETMGFMPGRLSIVGGFSSVGKSTFWVSVVMSMLSNGNKILVMTNEEESRSFKSKFLVWVVCKVFRYYKLTRKKIENGRKNMTDEEKKYFDKARKWWKENYYGNFFFVSVDTSDISIAKKKIREYILKEGIDVAVWDTMKLSENNMREARQDLALVSDSRELHNLARKYGIIILASMQLTEGKKGQLFLDASCLSNSKQVKEILETLLLMRRVYPEELDPKSSYYIRPYRLTKKDNVWEQEEIELDKDKDYVVIFLEKNRKGEDSSSGLGYLLRFDGAHSIFEEVCRCKPKHGSIGS